MDRDNLQFFNEKVRAIVLKKNNYQICISKVVIKPTNEVIVIVGEKQATLDR